MEIKMDRVKDLENFRAQYQELAAVDVISVFDTRIIIEVAEKPFVEYFHEKFSEQYESHKRIIRILTEEPFGDINPKDVYETWVPNFGHVKIITKE